MSLGGSEPVAEKLGSPVAITTTATTTHSFANCQAAGHFSGNDVPGTG